MRKYLLLAGGILGVLILFFLLVEALGAPLLTDPSPWMQRGGIWAAMIGFGLLAGDVFLPVPSSILMVAHGALFGVVLGTLLSLAGSVTAALVGFAVGRAGGPLLGRLLSEPERMRADRLLQRWGAAAIVLTRPIPLVAETVAILAGTTSLRWGVVALAALAGSLPPALLYALTGALAADFRSATLVFGLVMLVTAAFWFVGRRIGAGGEESS